MKLLESYSQFKEITTQYKEKGCRASNLFMLPDDIRAVIENRRMYYDETDNCLLLFVDEPGFYRCYYYCNAEASLKPYDLNDRDMVIEFPYNNEMNERQLKQVERIKELGFSLGRKSGEMILSPENIKELPLKTDEVGYAEESDGDQILYLLNDAFDPLYAYLPEKEQMLRMIDEKKVLVVRREGKVAGVLNSDVESNSAVIRHLAVDRRFRGCGTGPLLVRAFIKRYNGTVRAFRHWVDLDNAPAIRMYEKFGYSFSVRKADEYIKRRTV